MNALLSKRPLLAFLCLAALLGNILLQPIAAMAKTVNTGQLSFAKQVSINGKEFSPGQTLFNGDRVKVSGLGSAVLNLGKMGRIELGKDTEFILSITDDTIGGDLVYGCMGVLASGGVNSSVKTLKGVVSSDGSQPDSYFIGQRGKQGRLIPSLGEAKIMMDGKMETVATGESLDIDSPNGQNLMFRRTASTCTNAMTCACGLLPDLANNSNNQQQSNTNSPSPNSPSPNPPAPAAQAGGGGFFFPTLFSAVLGASMLVFFSNSLGGPVVSGNGLTCVDNTGFFCRQLSPTTPGGN